jgi:hypothetical protein
MIGVGNMSEYPVLPGKNWRIASVTMLSYSRIRQELNGWAAERAIARQPFNTAVLIDEDDTWLGRWSNDLSDVLVNAAVSDPDHPQRTLIDVCSGGAYGIPPSMELFESLSQANWRMDFGGPWTRRQKDGTIAFGWHDRYPSELFHEEMHQYAFGFLTGMIWEFGRVAYELAQELIGRHGGFPCRASDPNAWPPLLSGLLPPQ